MTIAELLRALVPQGWILPVLPGTQHVTVGGMIASDIHGKNHGVAGTFGTHVEAIGLLVCTGEVVELRASVDNLRLAAEGCVANEISRLRFAGECWPANRSSGRGA